LPQALIDRLFDRISEVSSLPDVALRIIELADDPTSEADDLLRAIRTDPALAMRLMRTVNSSYYALEEKVADLKQAITLLGLNEVRNLALTAYVAPLFRSSGQYRGYSRPGLWNHLVSVGLSARLIAETCGRVAPEEAYLSGLLHDVGLILIDQHLSRPFRRVLDRVSEGIPLGEAERQVLGFEHADLGQFVAARWNLPERLSASIGLHHRADQYAGPHRDMVSIVALANAFCHIKNVSSLGVRHVETPSVGLFTQLGLRKGEAASILKQLDQVLCAADALANAQIR
jgi:HD-like signal output (HDOD) protein